ncbi:MULTISPECIES: topoisomerase [Streptococcus]|uniref:topoisomerase n=1 Tax=Streptococcus TaxID=1301 RepID=UPI0011063784|nr:MULTISPECIES: topoisomerase [Streptococcus]HEV5386926.1 topoisomerase [Streptococcus pneumoniae]
MSCSENLKKEKELSAAIFNLKMEVLQNDDKLSSQSFSNIKRQARDLYQCLVWLQDNAEESGR